DGPSPPTSLNTGYGRFASHKDRISHTPCLLLCVSVIRSRQQSTALRQRRTSSRNNLYHHNLEPTPRSSPSLSSAPSVSLLVISLCQDPPDIVVTDSISEQSSPSDTTTSTTKRYENAITNHRAGRGNAGIQWNTVGAGVVPSRGDSGNR